MGKHFEKKDVIHRLLYRESLWNFKERAIVTNANFDHELALGF